MATSLPLAETIVRPSATKRMLGVAELFEQILLHLPFRWLLLAQRTPKSFQTAITTSSALRRKLYLEPIAVTDAARPTLARLFGNVNSRRTKDWSTRLGFQYCRKECFHVGPRVPSRRAYFRLIGVPKILTPSTSSWRNMLVTQPPLQDFDVHFVSSGGANSVSFA